MQSPFFFRLFSKSPFKKVKEHMGCVCEASEVLMQLLDQSQGQETLAATHDQICQYESQADDLKRDIREMLHTGVFLPVSRPVFLDMLDMQDRIINEMKDISGLMLSRRMVIPERFVPTVKEMIELTSDAAVLLKNTVATLSSLLESGFKGPALRQVRQWQADIEKMETKVDVLHFRLRSELYKVEENSGAIEIIFLYKVFAQIACLTDWVQSASGRFILLVSK